MYLHEVKKVSDLQNNEVAYVAPDHAHGIRRMAAASLDVDYGGIVKLIRRDNCLEAIAQDGAAYCVADKSGGKSAKYVVVSRRTEYTFKK